MPNKIGISVNKGWNVPCILKLKAAGLAFGHRVIDGLHVCLAYFTTYIKLAQAAAFNTFLFLALFDSHDLLVKTLFENISFQRRHL